MGMGSIASMIPIPLTSLDWAGTLGPFGVVQLNLIAPCFSTLSGCSACVGRGRIHSAGRCERNDFGIALRRRLRQSNFG